MFSLGIIRPALISCLIALVIEVIICIALSAHGMQAFAYYLSGSKPVAEITQIMWKASSPLPARLSTC